MVGGRPGDPAPPGGPWRHAPTRVRIGARVRYGRGRGLRRHHAGLRGSGRPAAAPGRHPRGRRAGHPPGPGRRRLRRRLSEHARRPDHRGALGVPPGGGHPGRAQVPAPAARAPTRSTTTRSWWAGRSGTSCWPACSSAGPTPPRPTPSSPWPSRPPARCPGRWASTTTSWSTPPTCWPGSRADQLAQAYLRATAERPAPRVDLSHVTVDTVTVSETVQAWPLTCPSGARPRSGS